MGLVGRQGAWRVLVPDSAFYLGLRATFNAETAEIAETIKTTFYGAWFQFDAAGAGYL
jgi:hypothetical protein